MDGHEWYPLHPYVPTTLFGTYNLISDSGSESDHDSSDDKGLQQAIAASLSESRYGNVCRETLKIALCNVFLLLIHRETIWLLLPVMLAVYSLTTSPSSLFLWIQMKPIVW